MQSVSKMWGDAPKLMKHTQVWHVALTAIDQLCHLLPQKRGQDMLWTQFRSKAEVWDVTLTAIYQRKKSPEHALGLVGF